MPVVASTEGVGEIGAGPLGEGKGDTGNGESGESAMHLIWGSQGNCEENQVSQTSSGFPDQAPGRFHCRAFCRKGGKGRNEIGMKAQLVQDQLFTSPPCRPSTGPASAGWRRTQREPASSPECLPGSANGHRSAWQPRSQLGTDPCAQATRPQGSGVAGQGKLIHTLQVYRRSPAFTWRFLSE